VILAIAMFVYGTAVRFAGFRGIELEAAVRSFLLRTPHIPPLCQMLSSAAFPRISVRV
jgi:hypothetical protein